MSSRRQVLPLMLIIFAASGCQTYSGGVTSILEAPAFHPESANTWVSNKDEIPLKYEFEPGSNVSGQSCQFLNVEDEVHQTEVVQINEDFEKISYPSEESLGIVVSKYIGLTVDEAKAVARQQNEVLRFRTEDGIITLDRCPGRITAVTKNGIVRSTSVEPDR